MIKYILSSLRQNLDVHDLFRIVFTQSKQLLVGRLPGLPR